MNRRKFIKTASGLLVPISLIASSHIPFGFYNYSTSSSSIDPEVLDWAARVTANGGTYNSDSLLAQDLGIKIIKAAGQRSLVLRWNLYCGLDLIACRTPLIIDKGSSIDGNNGFVPFVESDYSQSTGLVKATASANLDTGFTCNTDWTSDNDCAMGAYVRTNSSDTGAIMGSASGNVTYLLPSYGGTTTYASMHSTGTQQSFADTNGLGHYMVVRRASNDFKIYKNGISQVSFTTPDGNRPANTIVVHAYNALAPAYSNRIVAGYDICLGMTAAETLVHYNAIQAVQTFLGRNV